MERTTYKVYTVADTVPPLVISGVVGFSALFSVFLVYMYLLCKFHQGEVARVPCLKGMYAALSAVFRDAIKQKRRENEIFYLLLNRRIPTLFIPVLFYVIPFLFACLFTSFWEVFLIDVSYTCDPGLDCFPFDADNNNLQNDPLVNCTDFDTLSTDNITIICYEFVFRYAAGTALVGGLLAFIAIGIKLLGSLLVWSMNLDQEEELEEHNEPTCCSRCCHCCFKCLKIIVLLMLAFSPILLWIFVIVLITQVAFLRDALTERQNSVKFFAYFLTMLYLGLLVPILIMILKHSKTYTGPVQANITVNVQTTQASRDSNEINSFPDSGSERSEVRLLPAGQHPSYSTLK